MSRDSSTTTISSQTGVNKCAANHHLNHPEDRLCKYCLRIIQWSWPKRYSASESKDLLDHHPTYLSLSRSVTMGCKVCSVLKAGWDYLYPNGDSDLRDLQTYSFADIFNFGQFSTALVRSGNPNSPENSLCGFYLLRGSRDGPLFLIFAPEGRFLYLTFAIN